MKGVVDRFSEEFVETRMKALDKFLKRVADHPVLSFNPHLNAFLSAKVRGRRGGRGGSVRVRQPEEEDAVVGSSLSITLSLCACRT